MSKTDNTKKWILIALVSAACLAGCTLLSVAYGARAVTVSDIWQAFFSAQSDEMGVNVVKARIPRTIFGILAGAALGISGLLMQSITRNPIADPSILGINTGASLAVVCGMAFLHIQSGWQYIALSLIGAGVTAALVYGLASLGSEGATPVKLALSGATASISLQSLVNTVMLPNSQVLDRFRFWQTGSIGGITWQEIKIFLPWFVIGMAVSFWMAPALNGLLLGDEAAVSLGINVRRVRGISALAGIVLCAATTALAGPIGFVGLMIPHLMRLVLGSDLRMLVPMSAVGGSCLLLLSDVLGRLLGSPGELETGIITALLGAPVFIFIIRKVRIRSL